MGGKWLYKTACSILLLNYTCSFFSRHFVRVRVVQRYRSTDMSVAWKNLRFILSDISNFHIVDNVSIAVHGLPMFMSTSISVDEILLPRYMNLSRAVHVLPTCMLTSISVDEILLLRYMNLSRADHVLPTCMLTSISVDEILLPRYMNLAIEVHDLLMCLLTSLFSR